MFKKILVPVDGSETAFKALKLAIELARSCAADLIILSVYRHHGLREASMSMVRPIEPENMDKVLLNYSKDVAEKCKQYSIEQGVKKVRGFVKSGQPSRTIVNFAQQHKIDLIVIGSRGLGAMEGYLLGSVSHKVTSLAECPVMVV